MIAIELIIAAFFIGRLYQIKSIKELPKSKLIAIIFVVTLIMVKFYITKNPILGIITLQILWLAMKM